MSDTGDTGICKGGEQPHKLGDCCVVIKKYSKSLLMAYGLGSIVHLDASPFYDRPASSLAR